MKVSNAGLFAAMRWFLVLTILGMIAVFLLSFLQGSLGTFFSNPIFLIIGAVLIILMAMLRFSYFSYEDEYEIIHIDSKSLVLSPLQSQKHKHYEFAKNILKDFHIKKGFLKYELTLTVHSSSGEQRLRHFDLFFLGKKERQYVEDSLRGVLKKYQGQ